jgi:hypothetical protein
MAVLCEWVVFRRVQIKIKTKCREIHLRVETKSKYVGRIQNCNISIPRQEAASAANSCPLLSICKLGPTVVFFSQDGHILCFP